ncbi:amino acid permease domain-containing protein [Ditylenchus destructor]|nr:amino acid permease domain-containing protein [Ditylenchus destructor]
MNSIDNTKLLPNGESELKKTGGESDSHVHLKRRISLFNGCAIIMGVIVGSGIFISPKGVLVHAQTPFLSIVIWTLCGLYSTLGALCYAELGTTIAKTGGDYAYIAAAFGPLPAFVFLWIVLIIVNPTSNALVALTFSKYVLQPFLESCHTDIPIQLIAACLIAFLTAVNCYNVKWAMRTQNISTVTKVVALIGVILAGIYYFNVADENLYKAEFMGSSESWSPAHMAIGFYSGVFSFSGWNYLNFVTEEIINPYKNLPRAIYISLPLVTLIYVLANLAYFAALTTEEILASDAVAITFISKIFGPTSFMTHFVAPALVAISCIGGLNGIIFTASRMPFAGARDGQLPELFAMISLRYYTPTPSLLFLGITSIAMLFFADSLYALINYLAFAESAIVTTAVAGLLYLRITKPDLERPIKMCLAIPVIFLLMCLYILFVPLVLSPKELIIALGLIATGVPVYFIFVFNKPKSDVANGPWVTFTHAIQKLLFCVVGEEKILM